MLFEKKQTPNCCVLFPRKSDTKEKISFFSLIKSITLLIRDSAGPGENVFVHNWDLILHAFLC